MNHSFSWIRVLGITIGVFGLATACGARSDEAASTNWPTATAEPTAVPPEPTAEPTVAATPGTEIPTDASCSATDTVQKRCRQVKGGGICKALYAMTNAPKTVVSSEPCSTENEVARCVFQTRYGVDQSYVYSVGISEEGLKSLRESCLLGGHTWIEKN